MVLTQQDLENAAAKEAALKNMEAVAAQLNLVAQFLDAGLRLFCNNAPLQADVLTSLLAGQCVREGLKPEQLVGTFRTKVMMARRYEKANAELKAEVPQVEPDDVAAQVVSASQAEQGTILGADGKVPAGGTPNPDPEYPSQPETGE